ncbi:MAG: NAD(P)-dependent oxidoreductase [Acidimicrobiia bacterium]|nr:NAD(P)-dependent oxidoreductase [Acidimicrobiia bacterium]
MSSTVLVTGHNGYIGSVLTQVLSNAGHEVLGLDSYLFRDCRFGEDISEIPAKNKDIRDITASDLDGVDVICHLAGISNDPVGDLSPAVTDEVNHVAAVRLAGLARDAGVERFVFSSSCSIYGSSPGGWVDETSEINPVTPYGWSKIHVEREVSTMASDDFSPVFLRNATAYGVSPRLRADLVVNNMVGYAVTQDRVFMKSDGTPWRPLVHIEDIALAFLAAIEAPREAIHSEVFNVGSTAENYQIRDVARMIEGVIPDAKFEMAESAGPDIRNYRVNCDKIAGMLPYTPKWTVEAGIRELYEAFRREGLSEEQFFGSLFRIQHIKMLQERGDLDANLRLASSSHA